MKIPLILLVPILLCGSEPSPCGAAETPNRPRGRGQQGLSTEALLKRAPDSVRVLPDLRYREGRSPAWRLDLVLPKAEAPFPACIEDVKCAVRWLRAHAGEYGVDPKRIGGFGNSAGAHLVAMLGLAGPDAGLEDDGPWQDQSSLLQAVCASATPTDFALFGNPKRSSGALAESWSPIPHVRPDAPPFLLFHGTADRTVNVKHGDTFVAALKKAGAKDVTYLRIDGAGHGVYGQHADKTKPAMEAFFARTLGPVPTGTGEDASVAGGQKP